MFRFTRSSVALSLVISTFAASGLTACSDNTPTAAVAAAARAVAIAGYQQSVTVGTTGSDSLALVVYDANGALMSGATVQWAVSDGQGTLSSASSVTDANGIARVAFMAGNTAGVAHVAATVGSVGAVTFEEDLLAGAPARLVAMKAATDTLTVGAALTGTFIEVVDQYGNAVANVTVTATEQSAVDGDVLTSTVVTTDASGLVADTFTPSDVAGERVLVFTTDSGLTLSFRVEVEDGSQL